MFWADSSTSTIGKRRDPCRGFGARHPIGLLPGGRAYRKTRLSPSPPSRARRRLVQPPHTLHTLQVWLRTSAERHETERQKRARFLAQCFGEAVATWRSCPECGGALARLQLAVDCSGCRLLWSDPGYRPMLDATGRLVDIEYEIELR